MLDSMPVSLHLPTDAYDTTRLGVIIRDSEILFSESRVECEKTIRGIDTTLSANASLINPDSDPFEKSRIVKFVAIDGTRDILEGQSHARLFAGAYAVYGSFEEKVDITEIERGCAFSIVSLPYKILTTGNDYETENAGTIANLLMLLSEIFVALDYSEKNVDMILLDRPLCGTLAHTRTKIADNSVLKEMGARNISPKTKIDDLMPIFNTLCKRLFIDSHPEPLKIQDRYLSSDDLMYLCRIGIEKLFQTCRDRNIDLVGITKTTNDCSFLRLLITIHSIENLSTKKIRKIFSQIDDCRMLDIWIEPYKKIVCTREYDTALMTLMVDESKTVKEIGGGGVAPRKTIVRSYMSFGLKSKGGYVFAVERLVLSDEKPPVLVLPDNTDIFLFGTEGNTKQKTIFYILKGMCTGAFPEALYYPLPLALSHRFAKSNFDYVRPRLKASSYVFGREYGYNDVKRGFT